MNRLHVALIMGLFAAVIASAIAVVWARQANRDLFTQLNQLHAERDQLEIEFGRLQLEQATWGDPNRIETRAHDNLDMIEPDADDIRLIQP